MINIFKIDYQRLVASLVPPALRKHNLLEWLNCLVYPIQLLFNEYQLNRKNNLYKIDITPQVCYLQKAINDRYDYVQKRIRIVDVEIKETSFLYQQSENKPLPLFTKGENHPIPFYLQTETSAVSVDFLVLVPIELRYSDNEMRAYIDSYKLASKEYKIQTT
jgi:hypothetical protein